MSAGMNGAISFIIAGILRNPTQTSCPGYVHATSGCFLHAFLQILLEPSPGKQRAAACPLAHALPQGKLHNTVTSLVEMF